jgi:hypothetical protein
MKVFIQYDPSEPMIEATKLTLQLTGKKISSPIKGWKKGASKNPEEIIIDLDDLGVIEWLALRIAPVLVSCAFAGARAVMKKEEAPR